MRTSRAVVGATGHPGIKGPHAWAGNLISGVQEAGIAALGPRPACSWHQHQLQKMAAPNLFVTVRFLADRDESAQRRPGSGLSDENPAVPVRPTPSGTQGASKPEKSLHTDSREPSGSGARAEGIGMGVQGLPTVRMHRHPNVREGCRN